jgi:hypothetical protein
MMNRILAFSLIVSLAMASNVYSQQEVENPGFELWEEVGFGPDTLEPVNWSSLKTSDGGDFINEAIPVVWYQSTDAHSGMYSVKLVNQDILGLVAPGSLTNGRVHAAVPPTDAYVYTIKEEPQWHTPFTDDPDSLTLWAKYFPQDGDKAQLFAVLHSDTAKIPDPLMTDWVAYANITISEEYSEWTRFSIPFTYLSSEMPEYLLFAFFAGDATEAKVGSILYLDDIELTKNTTSVGNIPGVDHNIYLSNNDLYVKLAGNNPLETSTLEILNISGQVLMTETFSPGHTSKFHLNLPRGVYICKIKNSEMEITQKIVKQ